MTDETKKRTNEIVAEIETLESAISSLQYELEKINLRENADFTSKYVCYFDGEKDEFVFMHVDKQIYRKNGTVIHLQGPAIILDNDPLEDDESEICNARYEEFCGFDINEKIITDMAFSKIRTITEAEFTTVLNFWHKIMKKALIKK